MKLRCHRQHPPSSLHHVPLFCAFHGCFFRAHPWRRFCWSLQANVSRTDEFRVLGEDLPCLLFKVCKNISTENFNVIMTMTRSTQYHQEPKKYILAGPARHVLPWKRRMDVFPWSRPSSFAPFCLLRRHLLITCLNSTKCTNPAVVSRAQNKRIRAQQVA